MYLFLHIKANNSTTFNEVIKVCYFVSIKLTALMEKHMYLNAVGKLNFRIKFFKDFEAS